MALITLQQAKDHLRVRTYDRDGDIEEKVQQASAIVLDYLKSRSTAIASISVANPTVITTSVQHSLVSGATHAIAGTTTTPTVVGSHVVTVTGPTTFTVPVNVTDGQTTAAGTVGAATWTEETAPKHVQAAVLLVVGHLDAHLGDDMEADERLWQAIGRLLIRSRDPALA